MIPLIVPAILTDSFTTFKDHLTKVHKDFSSVQIDVIDGIFLPNKTFSEREELNDINSEAYFELHLMVKDPVAEIAKWKENNSVTNAVFHIEADVNAEQCIKIIKENGWKAGIALNPETKIEKIMPYIDMVDEILFMTVHPGQQGAPFLPEVLEKIKEFKKLGLNVTIAADGGINKHTIKSVVDAGAEKLYIGGAITQADDVEKAHEELTNI
ncbi:MAG: ribulose-phosphate 3-epimerase [Parcubacteria group bacterium Gr01-1014_13]|nr:MAG: ribulose-phosphate 3-epimerase [Parcubacteria group bacterium Gr01-1014_13]